MGPPVILQHRLEKTNNCSTYAARDFVQSTWNHSANGGKCHEPYDCGSLQDDPSNLLTCRGSEQPKKFFGGHKLGTEFGPGLAGWFFEFLQTVSDAHILKRIDQRRRGLRRAAASAASGGSSGAGAIGGTTTTHTDLADDDSTSLADNMVGAQSLDSAIVFDPGDYLDIETSEIEILLALFSPDTGIGSLIRIQAQITSEVQLDYYIQHYQATEGDKKHSFETITVFVILTCFIIMIEQSLVFHSRSRWDRNFCFRDELIRLLVQLSLQRVVPIVYFTTRLVQVEKSGDIMDHTVGQDGFAGIPWDSSSTPLAKKLQMFFGLVRQFEEAIFLEERMAIFFFVLAFLQFINLIIQTEAHPRTALLVKTIRLGADDIMHFLILCAIIMASFVLLGIAQFGYTRPEFRDGEAGFRTLWEMMLGSMLQSGATLSQTWTHEPLLLMFQIVYVVLVFLILLNFIIAIVVEAYMKVVNDLHECTVEQSLWQDARAMAMMLTLGCVHNWPRQVELIDHLKESKRKYVDYHLLRQLFPSWRNRKSKVAWLDFYASYDFLAPDLHDELSEDDSRLQELKDFISLQFSLMLGVAKPTMMECILEDRRLGLVGFHERYRRQLQEHAMKNKTNEPVSRTPSASKLPSKEEQARIEALAQEADRREKKKWQLLSKAIPPSVMIRDARASQHLVDDKVLTQLPAWVVEVLESQARVEIVHGKVQEARVDEHLLFLLNDDGWKAIGVEDAIVRAELIRRAQQNQNCTGRAAAKAVAGKVNSTEFTGNKPALPSAGTSDSLVALFRHLEDEDTTKGGGHNGQEGSGQGDAVSTVLPGEIEESRNLA